MITLGIDLSAQPDNTATCLIHWDPVVSVEFRRPAGDGLLAELINCADKVGIDVPLGWPETFSAAIASYANGGRWTAGHADKVQLRATDLYVKAETGHRPLSVAANLIAVPTMRLAGLLSSMGEILDRSGGGRIVEVYPAAALRRWELEPKGYKRTAGRAAREKLVSRFCVQAEASITLDDRIRQQCVDSDHAFDALVASLAARAHAKGLCDELPQGMRPAAQREGWIAMPRRGSLSRLA